MSKDKPKPRLTPEQNEARQAARAAKRERAKDARLIALMASTLQHGSRDDRIGEALHMLTAARAALGG